MTRIKRNIKRGNSRMTIPECQFKKDVYKSGMWTRTTYQDGLVEIDMSGVPCQQWHVKGDQLQFVTSS